MQKERNIKHELKYYLKKRKEKKRFLG